MTTGIVTVWVKTVVCVRNAVAVTEVMSEVTSVVVAVRGSITVAVLLRVTVVGTVTVCGSSVNEMGSRLEVIKQFLSTHHDLALHHGSRRGLGGDCYGRHTGTLAGRHILVPRQALLGVGGEDRC